jgi:uncharacterized membrane protein (TIGR01218 family)
LEVTKKDVEKLIEVRKENTFLNHLWNIFSRDMTAKGQVSRSEIKVWRQNMWNMTFYPIFTFEFNPSNHLTNITDKLNPIGKILVGIIIVGFIYIVFPKNISNFRLVDNWEINLIISVFAFLFVWVARKVYKLERNNQLEDIFEVLDVEIEEKISEKEWSLKNILIRLFTYPFSIFVICICVWSLFENGVSSIFLKLTGIGMCGMYLFADIKMIIRAKKTTGKNVYKKQLKSMLTRRFGHSWNFAKFLNLTKSQQLK